MDIQKYYSEHSESIAKTTAVKKLGNIFRRDNLKVSVGIGIGKGLCDIVYLQRQIILLCR